MTHKVVYFHIKVTSVRADSNTPSASSTKPLGMMQSNRSRHDSEMQPTPLGGAAWSLCVVGTFPFLRKFSMSVRVPPGNLLLPLRIPSETPSALRILPENSFCPQESTGNTFSALSVQPRTPSVLRIHRTPFCPQDSTRTPSALWIPSETTFCHIRIPPETPGLPSGFQPRTPFSPQDSTRTPFYPQDSPGNHILPSSSTTSEPSSAHGFHRNPLCPQDSLEPLLPLRIPLRNPFTPQDSTPQNPTSALRILPKQPSSLRIPLETPSALRIPPETPSALRIPPEPPSAFQDRTRNPLRPSRIPLETPFSPQDSPETPLLPS